MKYANNCVGVICNSYNKKKKMKFDPYLTAYTKSFTQGRDTCLKEDIKIINHKRFKIKKKTFKLGTSSL